MMDALKALFKQPYWVIALVLGGVLVPLPCITVDKDYHWSTHPPSTLWPVVVGVGLLALSGLGFAFTLWTKRTAEADAGACLDLGRVKESKGVMWTTVSGCEIRVVNGQVEDHALDTGTVIVLPCNEYFDDRCAGDTRSALGAYVNRAFDGRVEAFVALLKGECKSKLGPGVMQQKTNDERAESFGAGRCVLLLKPLGHSVPVALVSTTTQRAGQGLAARISYLFDGMRELVQRLADARLNEVAMPIMGAGHGHIDPPLALVGLLLALAEAACYGRGGQRLRRVTVIVFKRDADTPAQVDRVVVKRALALIGSRD
jgi:hypothetical protein